ncbi:MAG: 16S rRNA (guanine(966)-N(2))-methyltransferase RsmD [Syntrophales bacterium]|nr:16S rRNA (guanine(966)-N(2))-methyltransferase RsmD [Syntrophales bacterium]
MRIIGGQAKGRRIFVPKGHIRPTSDMIKEALFNILPPMEGKTFLDLFAGTGSIGLEAMSRGAVKVVFVEVNRFSIETIKKNLSVCGFNNKHEIISASVRDGVKLLNKKKEQFDVIFADPPYERGFIKETLCLLGSGSLVSEDGIIVIQHSCREESDWNADEFALMDQKRYSDTMVSFLKMHSERI